MLVAITACAASVSLTAPARAGGLKGLPDPGIEDHNLVIGPSLAAAAVAGAETQPSFGLDVTYSYSILWASLGARFIAGDEWVSLPYGEVGVWLLANVGAGCTVIQGGPRSGDVAPHLFVGLPIPISTAARNKFRTIVLEPYYRPAWWEGNALHEVGLLLKVIAWGRKSRPDPSPTYQPAPRTEPPLVAPTELPPASPPAPPEEPPHAPLAPDP